MATLDDKILGEKLQNYCSSSSEDESVDDDIEGASENRRIKAPKFIPESEASEYERWNGCAQNTGPKGVIKDWQRYKQLERNKTAENEIERKNLLKKLTLTCKTDLEEKEMMERCNDDNNKAASGENLDDDLLNDPYFEEYLKRTLESMQKRIDNSPKFGKLIELRNDTYLNEIDNENKCVTIIVHIYDNHITECRTMNQCLEILANDYKLVKFCKVRSNEINLTDKFRKMGCPALLVYKNGELIGNFVRLGDEFGQDFYASDVESFLIEHSLLPTTENSAIRSSVCVNNDSDSSND